MVLDQVSVSQDCFLRWYQFELLKSAEIHTLFLHLLPTGNENPNDFLMHFSKAESRHWEMALLRILAGNGKN